MIILLHTSKTMRRVAGQKEPLREPALIEKTKRLAGYVSTLTPKQLASAMHISAVLAQKTHHMLAGWDANPARQSPTIDSFIGDIYSGLRADTLTQEDRDYADAHLRILSGLYGILRPYDGISPYRLEMGYTLPSAPYKNLYVFWGEDIAKTLPQEGIVVNLASVEYSRTVTQYIRPDRIVAPKFLTKDQKSGEPTFVVVHAKIARGAFARWLITSRTTDPSRFQEFADIGYRFSQALSTPQEPVYVCEQFEGKGLSMRLQAQRS